MRGYVNGVTRDEMRLGDLRRYTVRIRVGSFALLKTAE